MVSGDRGDGGPAFPAERMEAVGDWPPYTSVAYPGMSLRDWFAGQALMGLFAGQWNVEVHRDTPATARENATAAAGNAYLIADAMIAARSALSKAMPADAGEVGTP